MDFEKQKPITDAYRQGWERIWGRPDCARDELGTPVVLEETANSYPNGCPILKELA